MKGGRGAPRKNKGLFQTIANRVEWIVLGEMFFGKIVDQILVLSILKEVQAFDSSVMLDGVFLSMQRCMAFGVILWWAF